MCFILLVIHTLVFCSRLTIIIINLYYHIIRKIFILQKYSHEYIFKSELYNGLEIKQET